MPGFQVTFLCIILVLCEVRTLGHLYGPHFSKFQVHCNDSAVSVGASSWGPALPAMQLFFNRWGTVVDSGLCAA